MLMVVPDPERVTSTAPQEIPDLGITTPLAVADSGKSRAEWEKLIKQTGAPLVVKDVKKGDEG